MGEDVFTLLSRHKTMWIGKEDISLAIKHLYSNELKSDVGFGRGAYGSSYLSNNCMALKRGHILVSLKVATKNGSNTLY